MSEAHRRSAVIEAHEAGDTLAAVVRRVMGQLPWSKARNLITTGRVRLDGAPVFDPVHRVMGGEVVEVDPGARRQRVPELEPQRILHVDHDIVVVDKPAGLITVPFDERDIDSLEARVQAHLAKTAPQRKGRKGPPPLYTVHRLDKETSGVLVFALTRRARKVLEDQLRKHSFDRRYVALVHGRVDARSFEGWLVPDRGDGKRGSWQGGGKPPKQAKRAITHVQREEMLRDATLVSCKLETGRQHQIRIHLGEAGHPLFGERIYGRAAERRAAPADRVMLHAELLAFRHPATDRMVHFRAERPADFAAKLDALRR